MSDTSQLRAELYLEMWKVYMSFCSFDLRLPCFSLIPNRQEDIHSMLWKTANKGLTLDLKLGMLMGAFIAFSGYSVITEATENAVKSRHMSSLGCDGWTSYRVHQLLRLQDVLLHLIRLGLHARDEYGQIIGLSPAWEHRPSSAPLQHSTEPSGCVVYTCSSPLWSPQTINFRLGLFRFGSFFSVFFPQRVPFQKKTFAITSAWGSAKGERWLQEQEVSFRLPKLFDLYLSWLS